MNITSTRTYDGLCPRSKLMLSCLHHCWMSKILILERFARTDRLIYVTARTGDG